MEISSCSSFKSSGCGEGGGDPESGDDDFLVLRLEGGGDGDGGKRSHVFKGPEGVPLAERIFIQPDELLQLVDGFIVGGAVAEEALCHVAVPAVGVYEKFHEIRGRKGFHVGDLLNLSSFGGDAVDAAVAGAGPIETLGGVVVPQVGGDVGLVLDDAVIHVQEVDGAVWGVVDIDRAKALIGGGEPLAVRVGCGRR